MRAVPPVCGWNGALRVACAVVLVYFVPLLVLIGLSAFFSGSETAIFAYDRIEARELAQHGKGPLAHLYRRMHTFLPAVLFLNLLANLGIGVFSTVMTVASVGEVYLPLTGAAVTAVMVIVAEIGPKVLAVRYTRRIAHAAAWPMVLLMTVLAPLITVLVWGCRLVQRLAPWKALPLLTPDELRFVVDDALQRRVLTPREAHVLSNIIVFRTRPLSAFMTPRTEIVYLPLDAPADELVARVRLARFARLPVTAANDIDTVVGCVHVKELLLDEVPILASCVRPVYFAPGCMTAGALFQALRDRDIHMALVVDEYGQVSGLVSVHDLVEELMGDNPDEYTPETPWVARALPDGWVVNATRSVAQINRSLGLALPEDRDRTLGGFLMSLAGHLPERGESLAWGDWEFRVQALRRRRVTVVRVARRGGG